MTAPADITAVILAGGLGTRLREITQDRCPKPMVPVAAGDGSVPFLEFVLGHLARQGVSRFVICIGHLGEQIVRHFGDGAHLGLSIRYDDAGAADTGARVARAAGQVPDPLMLVTCGDVFLPLDPGALLRAAARHPGWQAALAGVPDPGGGAANMALDADGAVTAYGPLGATPGRHALEAGTFVLRPAALAGRQVGAAFSLTHDLFPALAREGGLGAVVVSDLPFFDIGTPEGYRRFCAFAAAGRATPISGLCHG